MSDELSRDAVLAWLQDIISINDAAVAVEELCGNDESVKVFNRQQAANARAAAAMLSSESTPDAEVRRLERDRLLVAVGKEGFNVIKEVAILAADFDRAAALRDYHYAVDAAIRRLAAQPDAKEKP
jgi:hypothetical protein